MAYRHFHDSQNKMVYKVDEPSIIENKDKRGQRSSWYISTKVHITRADNVLTGSQWKYKILDLRYKYFKPKYSRENVIEYFMSRVYPRNCLEISSEEYDVLQKQYETDARNNRLP